MPALVRPSGENGTMAFGQHAGPPATHRQLDELLNLLMNAGFESFKEARYPMDFSQRQAGGKFTRDEADEFIEKLSERGKIEEASLAPVQKVKKPTASQQSLRKFSDEDLAAELQRRGWIVAEP